jgi:hypothetical protein
MNLSNKCKLHIRPLVRQGAPRKLTINCVRKAKTMKNCARFPDVSLKLG